MILQELVRYYDRERAKPGSEIAPPGWVRRPVDYVVVLREDGTCLDLQQQFSLVSGRRVGVARLLPAIGKQALKHTNSGRDANLLWDNSSFLLGTGARGTQKLASFFGVLDDWFPQSLDPGVGAVRRFVESLQSDPGVAQRLVDRFGAGTDFEEREPVLAFRLDTDGVTLVHERDPVRRAYESRLESAGEGHARGRCLVTGEDDVPMADKETVVKGVWKSQTSGANLVSFNAPAFTSYGIGADAAHSVSISQGASSAYSTALNYLLADESRHKVQVGDASTVFWADRPSRFDGEFTLADLFGESREDPDRGVRAVQALFDSLKTGQLPLSERDVEFFVLVRDFL